MGSTFLFITEKEGGLYRKPEANRQNRAGELQQNGI
jgi:hypothetical protein